MKTSEKNTKVIKETIFEVKNDNNYITIRNSLATKAEKITNDITDNDKNHPFWNRIYFAKVDELAFKAGLQSARFHKDVEFISTLYY